MELFAVINRNFRRLFLEQEEMRTFKAYDSSSVSGYDELDQFW